MEIFKILLWLTTFIEVSWGFEKMVDLAVWSGKNNHSAFTICFHPKLFLYVLLFKCICYKEWKGTCKWSESTPLINQPDRGHRTVWGRSLDSDISRKGVREASELLYSRHHIMLLILLVFMSLYQAQGTQPRFFFNCDAGNFCQILICLTVAKIFSFFLVSLIFLGISNCSKDREVLLVIRY